MLRRHLLMRRVRPERCAFRLVAHGPILPEAKNEATHRRRRDIVAAMEKALAEAMTASGYSVMNGVKSRKPLDGRRFAKVRAAFATSFSSLVQEDTT